MDPETLSALLQNLDLIDRVGTVGDGDLLTTLERLRRELSPAVAAAVVEQARLRQRAGAKFTRADRMLFVAEALEQASAEEVATHRATRFPAGGSIVDLGCGIGGDAIALAAVGRVVAVDHDPVRVAMCEHNLSVYGRDGSTRVDDVLVTPLDGFDAAFADPGRRTRGRRTFAVDEYAPPLTALIERVTPQVVGLAVKAHPGILDPDVPEGAEVEVVSLRGDVKEAVLWLGDLRSGAGRSATLLPAGHTIPMRDPRPDVPVTGCGRYLHEPDGAIIRAHVVEEVAADLDLRKIDHEIAYLTGDVVVDSPLVSSYAVEVVMPFNLKRLKAHLRGVRAGRLVVKKRGSPVDPDGLRRRLAVPGEESRVVIVTRVGGDPTAIVCHPPRVA